MQGEVGESSLIIKLRIIENREIRGNGGRVIFRILVPPVFKICRSHGARGNQKSGEGGGQKASGVSPRSDSDRGETCLLFERACKHGNILHKHVLAKPPQGIRPLTAKLSLQRKGYSGGLRGYSDLRVGIQRFGYEEECVFYHSECKGKWVRMADLAGVFR